MGAFWLRYIGRSLVRGGRRTAFALLCITVGVAGVVALQLATLTVQSALTSNIRAANGGDISVVSTDNPLAPSDLALFRHLQATGKVTSWAPVASLHATAVGPAGALIPFEVQAVPIPPYPLGGQPTFVTPSSGNVASLMATRHDVLISSVLADELGAHAGDQLQVNGIGGPGLKVTVRGVLAETSFEHAAVMTVRRAAMPALTNESARYTGVFIDTHGPAAPVAAVIREHFPLAQVQTVQEALQTANLEVHDFRQFMLLVGLLALLIAGIGILNAVQSLLVWRRLEIAMLKAMGYRQRMLFLLFGGEAVALGLIGGITGTILGAIGSKLISSALARALALQVTFQLDAGTIAGGVGLGVGTTLIFALLPIARAAAFRPLELLREGAGGDLRGVSQTLGLLVIVLGLFGALAAAIMGDVVLAGEFVLAAAAACAVLTAGFALVVTGIGRLGPPRHRVLGVLGLAVLLVLTVAAAWREPALAPILALATLVWGALALLAPAQLLSLLMAVRSLSRRRARTSVTLVAFLTGVLAMTLTLTVALSLKGQIDSLLSGSSGSNLLAIAPTHSEGSVLRATRHLPGIHHHSVTVVASTSPIQVNGTPVSALIGHARPSSDGDSPLDLLAGVSGLDLRSGTQPQGLYVVQGRPLGPPDAGTNNVIMRTALRTPPWNLHLGDQVTLQGASSGVTRTVRVVGFFRRNRRALGSFFLAPVIGDRSAARALAGADAQSVLAFTVDPISLTDDAARIQRTVPGVLVVDLGDLTRVVDTVLGELLNLLAVITALALGAGLSVVANGVALAMLERRREIALFKAIGFGPAKVMRFVLIENALAGTLAGAVSVLAVVTALAALSHFALDRAIGFDPVVATWVLVGAAALAVGTAYVAARTPIRVRPLETLRNE